MIIFYGVSRPNICKLNYCAITPKLNIIDLSFCQSSILNLVLIAHVFSFSQSLITLVSWIK